MAGKGYDRPMRSRLIAAVALTAAGAAASGASATLGPSPSAAARRAFTIRPAHYRATVRFRISYTGSGRFATTYHSTPPNPGGAADNNSAHDTSQQRWSLTFQSQLRVPPCHALGHHDPCAGIHGVTGAVGSSSASGSVVHRHLDGLYPAQDQSVSCHVRARSPRRAVLGAALQVRYDATRRALLVSAGNPVATALLLLPRQCPGQGDSIDGLNDEYFGPGFSFSSAYGPDRWFRSQTVVIPVAVLHRARAISVRLHQTSAGTPPAGCDVPQPAFERCSTGGAWSATLRLSAIQS
jgi:hypothetical protein